MRKFCFTTLAALLCAIGATAQNNGMRTRQELPAANELGLRYGAQLALGSGLAPELEAVVIDYARYNYYNIGFRTGLNVFLDGDVSDYYSVPLQFTWRTARMRGLVLPRDAEAGSWIVAALMSILPRQFEVHTGFTPGMLFGPLGASYQGDFFVRHRFSCTFDAGVRLIIPIWRFNLYGDFTYHRYLTDNFGLDRGPDPTRSYMGMGVGLSFDF